MTTMTRGQFLRGDLAGRRSTVRPPWSIAEAAFVERCTRCDRCLEACEIGLLVAGRGGYPELRFEAGGCTFCGACARACQTGAIAAPGGQPPWWLRAVIGEACLARQGVVCRSCGDFCDAHAIRFNLRSKGVAIPLVDVDLCTGCGACVTPCPSGAVGISRQAALPVAA